MDVKATPKLGSSLGKWWANVSIDKQKIFLKLVILACAAILGTSHTLFIFDSI